MQGKRNLKSHICVIDKAFKLIEASEAFEIKLMIKNDTCNFIKWWEFMFQELFDHVKFLVKLTLKFEQNSGLI